MAKAFAVHLPHFRVDQPARGIDFGRLKPLGDATVDTPRDAVQEALAKARVEATAEAEVRFAALRAEDRAAHERDLAERERRFAEATADALVQGLAEGLAAIEAMLSEHVARALSRFLAGAVRERALGELAQTVAGLLATAACTKVRITGPEALIERFRARLGDVKAAVDLVVDSGRSDLAVTLDDTIVETRIADWMDRLSAAANGEPHG
jgi:hypothetical protein